MKSSALLREEPYPLQRTLGYEVTAWEDGFARVEMELSELHENRHGIPHGGVYAVLIDTAAGFCGCYRPLSEPKVSAMTLSLTVNFVGLPQGRRLIAEGRKTGGGAKTFFADMTLNDEMGTLVATGSAVLRYRTQSGNPARRDNG